MIKQIKNLIKLQLVNLYGMNVFRFTKDKKEKMRKRGLAFVYVLLIIMACGYIGTTTFGYIFIGLAEMIPAYLIMLSSLLILFLSIFKVGSVIFQKNAYDILCSLPISQTAIVVSRFIRMYVENLLIAFVVMLSGILVYGVMVQPRISFYLIGIIVTLFIPLIPITIATFFGALITAIASRMKHKSLVSAVLFLLVFLGIMLGTSQLSGMEESVSVEMLQNLSGILHNIIESMYPPAIWLGSAMLNGNFWSCFACVVGELLIFALVMAVVSVNFQWICRGLYSTSAKHNYQMENLKKGSVLSALYKRELKRYVSSSIYVTNTIIGPIMAVIYSITVLSMGVDKIQQGLGLPINFKGLVPFVLAMIFCIMTTTCTSISMEGKEWWIVKSLPIKTKELLDSKLLFNLSLILPFFLVSEVLLTIALKPDFVELVWLIGIPVVMILFSCVFGITINLKMPVFEWENEVVIVKQSASSAIGGLGGGVIVLICTVPVLVVPTEYESLVKVIICMLIAGCTYFLYRKNNAVNLQEL
ncbi:MAG: hypothetical protein IJA36_00695 [Lachnospiraceae bacterium]|nr:hypothetical protein [Lachnospiraceae bacterium]